MNQYTIIVKSCGVLTTETIKDSCVTIEGNVNLSDVLNMSAALALKKHNDFKRNSDNIDMIEMNGGSISDYFSTVQILQNNKIIRELCINSKGEIFNEYNQEQLDDLKKHY